MLTWYHLDINTDIRPMTEPNRPSLDPVFVHGRREAIVILAAFLVLLVWSVGCCYMLGYSEPSEMAGSVSMVLGIPSWVFWGVAVPWIAADLFTIWFCFWYMSDDDLGEVHEGADLSEQVEGDVNVRDRTLADGADG